jgi:hypothetical protein
MLQQADEGHGLMRIEENEKLGAEISVSSESELNVSDTGHQSTDIFKKLQFIIGHRIDKVVGKVRNIDTKPQEHPIDTEDTGNISGPDSGISCVMSPAQKIKKKVNSFALQLA